MPKFKVYAVLIFLTTLAACSSRPACKNTDPVFDQYGPGDQQYKYELIKKIKSTDTNRVHYTIADYVEIDHKPFISINIQSDSFCAQMLIDLKNPNKLRHFKNVKGLAYRGREIKGLQYKTDTADGQYKFVFEEGTIVGKKQ